MCLKAPSYPSIIIILLIIIQSAVLSIVIVLPQSVIDLLIPALYLKNSNKHKSLYYYKYLSVKGNVSPLLLILDMTKICTININCTSAAMITIPTKTEIYGQWYLRMCAVTSLHVLLY
eukprot:Tbor_TRINITY_DN5461_c0_g1::TRINITY_DN5461_c0_g1_i3::g.25091::m.25091